MGTQQEGAQNGLGRVPVKILKLLSAVCIVLVVAVATVRAEVQRLERAADRHAAYVYVHSQYVDRLDHAEDVIQECNEWLGSDSDFELWEYNGEGLRAVAIQRAKERAAR